MGMYTELVFKAEIRGDIPDEVEAILDYLFNRGQDESKPTALPNHEFFSLPRWSLIGSCSSFYHTPFALSKYATGFVKEGKGGYVFSRSDLKNYGGEIEAFLAWINPYIEEEVGHCIGWSWYEEEEKPTLVFKL